MAALRFVLFAFVAVVLANPAAAWAEFLGHSSSESSERRQLAACAPYKPTVTPYTAPKCQAKMYAKYGNNGFQAVLNGIVDKAFLKKQEQYLGKSFSQLAKQGTFAYRHFAKQLGYFLVLAYGGPNEYTGPSMLAAHAGLNITVAQYNYFILDVVVPALKAAGVKKHDILKCFAPQVTASAFSSQIIECA